MIMTRIILSTNLEDLRLPGRTTGDIFFFLVVNGRQSLLFHILHRPLGSFVGRVQGSTARQGDTIAWLHVSQTDKESKLVFALAVAERFGAVGGTPPLQAGDNLMLLVLMLGTVTQLKAFSPRDFDQVLFELVTVRHAVARHGRSRDGEGFVGRSVQGRTGTRRFAHGRRIGDAFVHQHRAGPGNVKVAVASGGWRDGHDTVPHDNGLIIDTHDCFFLSCLFVSSS
mmetsp:Transcript_7127/g.14622  ORF Transcript_7127/g.14622 Transcript_7127/m.14622 type:complete len:226 (-) Transcript_7127:175-852(-)